MKGNNQNKVNETNMRHSGAHLLAYAVQSLYPNVKLAIGPAIDDGFYYDFDFGDIKIQEEDLVKIERRMLDLQKNDYSFEKVEMTIYEAKKFLKDTKQPYSLSLLKDIESMGSTMKSEMSKNKGKVGSDIVTFYKIGDFINLCRGGHIKSLKDIGPFKLTSIAGAYFRGDEKNPMLTRIYAVCFKDNNTLLNYLKEKEESKNRDHRVIGEKLKIFMISEDVGQGLPLLMPNGEQLKYLLERYMRKIEERLGYKYVSTPILTNRKLYERSGHVKFYSEDMYQVKDKENNVLYIKPMNCPHHHMIFEKMVQSYKQLPFKLAEESPLYRNERSGTLTGLIRVRGPITQNDSHIYVSKDQLKKEFLDVLSIFKTVYKDLGIKNYYFRLSLPDFKKDKYEGDKAMWDFASSNIRDALKESNSEFKEEIGEAAFYGPKLDIQIKNVYGKEDSIATIQIDILVPKRMGLKYINKHGEEETPIVIHRSILGSYERFIAFMIEQTGGNFPLEFAPIQVKLISVSEKYNDTVENLAQDIRDLGVRVDIDITEEGIGKKVRNASLEKIPAKIVIGEKEILNKKNTNEWKFTINWRDDLKYQSDMSFGEFLKLLKENTV
ncbi:MAG: threonine--tRNA ligase [Patescibacteria group bacterium]